MPLELISADDVVSGRRKKKSRIDDKIKITKKTEKTEKIEKIEKVERVDDVKKMKVVGESEKIDDDNVNDDASSNVIIKRIYFPGSTYSNNQAPFKKIIKNAGLSWVRQMMKTYFNKRGNTLLTGVYENDDGSKRVFCVYEGSGKPATMFVKVIVRRSIDLEFLKELNDFCESVGCVFEDKDETYLQRVFSRLHEYGDINIPEPKDAETEKKEKMEFEKNVDAYIERQLDDYIDCYRDWLNIIGVDSDVARYFRRRDIEKGVAWAIEHGFVKV